MGTEVFAVEPEYGVHGNAFKTEEYPLGGLLGVQSEMLEIVGGVLRQGHLAEIFFPNARHLDCLRACRIGRIPAIDDARIFRVE